MTKTKPDPDIIITMRIPRTLDTALSALAKTDERTKAAVIRLAIREYLERRTNIL